MNVLSKSGESLKQLVQVVRLGPLLGNKHDDLANRDLHAIVGLPKEREEWRGCGRYWCD